MLPNAVVVGDEAELLAPGLAGERLHWIGDAPPAPVGGHGEDPLAASRRRGAGATAGKRPRRGRFRWSHSADHARSGRAVFSHRPASSAAAGLPGGSEVRRGLLLSLLALALIPADRAAAQATPEWREWNRPVEPFRIAPDLYYVGASDIASYLITTPAGHLLLDGGFG
ncbi:MAG: hypothetical protein R2862_09100 [Thermoanaerobaculia bacterium]